MLGPVAQWKVRAGPAARRAADALKNADAGGRRGEKVPQAPLAERSVAGRTARRTQLAGREALEADGAGRRSSCGLVLEEQGGARIGGRAGQLGGGTSHF